MYEFIVLSFVMCLGFWAQFQWFEKVLPSDHPGTELKEIV